MHRGGNRDDSAAAVKAIASTQDSRPQGEDAAAAVPSVADEDGGSFTTRRRFLGGAGKKAAFVVPVVWTLSAPKAMAAGSNPSANPSCATDGEICVTNTDCCSNVCAFGQCVGD